MYLKIILLTVAIGAVLKILSDRFERFKPHSWWVGLAGAIATAIVCVVAFWQTEEKLLSIHDSQEISDSLRTDIFVKVDSAGQEITCRFDSLEVLILRAASLAAPDPECQTLAREQAECLHGIVKTAFDSGVVAIGLQEYHEALVHLKYGLRAAAGNPTLLSKMYTYIGLCFFYLDSHKVAISYYDSAMDKRVEANPILLARAVSQYTRGDYLEAVSTCNEVLEHDNSFALGWRIRGSALETGGALVEAAASYDSALKYDPEDHRAWFTRGRVLGRLGDDEEAILSFDRALQLRGDFSEVWDARFTSLLAMRDFQRAAANCDSAMVYLPDSVRFLSSKAIACLLMGDIKYALACCDSALRHTPNDSSVMNLRAMLVDVAQTKVQVRIVSDSEAIRQLGLKVPASQSQSDKVD